jgi:amino acid adenylation domain-containing protein/thioester reductase-like protein
MTITDISDITPTPGAAQTPKEITYVVAVNDQGQHAAWPAELDLPAGWRQQSAVMPKRACLAAIAASWPDIAPVSVRRAGREPEQRDASGRGAEDRYEMSHEHNVRYVHDLFGEQAARRPHSAAIVSAGIQLTYRQLDESANQLAHHLQEMGVGPETLVGVCLERGTEAIRCLLAILKAAGAYLPLDPSLPDLRLTQMCAEARPAVVLVRRADARAFSGTDAQLLVIDEWAPELASQPTTAPSVRPQAENMAYAIYTSGSTGRPKAVAVSHGSLACVSQEISREYQISTNDRVLQLAALGFDTSVEQILVTLICGATLMLPAAGTVAPTDLLRYLSQEQVSVIDLTPAYWRQVVAITAPDDERLRSVRLMITGGERADPADCGAARRAAPGARLLNAYGLTETTITSTLFDAGEELAAQEPPASIPVGKPLRHAQVLVLDNNLNRVPAGEVGETYIGGCGIARGYLGRPELTAERFVPNRHSVVPGSRMYRTGDLGRWRADHNLEVLGRVDDQLKIRGFRVEPAEIESALISHPDVTGVAVVPYEFGPGNRQLAAYYTPRRTGEQDGSAAGMTREPPSGAILRSFLSARVPGFMVPAVFIAMDQLPLTREGAVDRQALPHSAIAVSGSLDGGFTPIQAGLSHLWSRILDTGRVSLDDEFFQLGGNSLLAAEMLAHVRVMFGISPNYVRPLTRSLLRDPTLRGFSEATQNAHAGRLTADGADPRVNFIREAELVDPVRLDAGPRPDWKRPRKILLTGSTGFFGVHLLHELLTGTNAEVHCLVRARSTSHARQRIIQAAERYELKGLDIDRVVLMVGDIAEPNLGLAPGTFDELARTIDVIHHAGAMVNFTYPYQDLKAANVTGTRELIRLAGLYRGIPIHYVSTTAVLAGFGAIGVREVTEDTPLAYADHLCMGYIETKFVAEELLRNAGRAGLPVTIYRPLDVVGDHRTGVWNTATEMCALIRFITDSGVAPDIDLPLDFVPVDICAAAMTFISSQAEAAGRTYHLASPKYALLGSLVDRLRSRGFVIKTIPYRNWVDELLKYAAQNPSHPMTPFVPLFVDVCEGPGLTVAEMYLEHIFPSYTRSNTEQALIGSGIVFPPVDELLDLNIDRLIATGYLRAPTEQPDIVNAEQDGLLCR